MIAKANQQPKPLIDLEAEANLLAAMIERPSVIDEVSRLIDATAFSDSGNASLFDLLRLLHEAGKPFGDAKVLYRSLVDAGCDWTAGELAALLRDHFTSEPAYEADRLVRLAKLRRMQSALASTAARCSDHGADPDAIGRDLADTLLADESKQLTEVESVYAIGERVLQSITSRDKSRGLMLGLQALDEAIGVVCPGEMVVLAARPGVGKSALAMQFAAANAQAGRDVLFVSLEMTGDELTQRLLCSFAGVNQADLRTGSVSDADRAALKQAREELPRVLRTWAPAGATMAELRGVARLDARRHNLRLIVIDYLQLVDGSKDDRGQKRYEQITRVSREIKQLAKTIGVPVLALSQLSRAGNDKPQLIHLRESGAIEQDADCVLLLSRNGRQAILDVAKHRHGETGELPLIWHGRSTCFTDSNPAEEF